MDGISWVPRATRGAEVGGEARYRHGPTRRAVRVTGGVTWPAQPQDIGAGAWRARTADWNRKPCCQPSQTYKLGTGLLGCFCSLLLGPALFNPPQQT